jgi:hypothetical protein
MKTKIIALAVLFGAPLLVSAQELQTKLDMYAPLQLSKEWKYSSAIWDQYSGISSNQTPGISLGRSRVTLGGPLIQTFQRPRDWSDLSRGEKFLSLPIINLFVPQPMPRPPGGTGKYFKWGQSDQPWDTVAAGTLREPGLGSLVPGRP